MIALTVEQLLLLARAYSAGTGIALTGIGERACGNNRIFMRLAEGRGANVLAVERATRWFAQNWPAELPWPKEVPALRLAA